MDVKAVGSVPVTRTAMQSAATASSGLANSPSSAAAPAAASVGSSSAALYISPVVRYDQTAKLAVLLFRDADTGETRDQIPAEKVVEQYRRNGGRSLALPATGVTADADTAPASGDIQTPVLQAVSVPVSQTSAVPSPFGAAAVAFAASGASPATTTSARVSVTV